jgi:hypothetical protein
LKLIANTSGMGTTRWINAYVKEFPIARNTAVELEIAILVDDIINQKRHFPIPNTTALETQIDQLVYQLYNLTEEEVAIVEEATG